MTQPSDYDETQRLKDAALALWGCRRPDKRHHISEEGAQTRLARQRDRVDGEPVSVYHCCALGWVWGRPNPPCICTSGTPDPACEYDHARSHDG